jgi:hypothetical protein
MIKSEESLESNWASDPKSSILTVQNLTIFVIVMPVLTSILVVAFTPVKFDQ